MSLDGDDTDEGDGSPAPSEASNAGSDATVKPSNAGADTAGVKRRRFLRGAAATATAGVGLGVAGCLGEEEPSGDAGDPPEPAASVTRESDGEGVIYQYFHTPWREVEADLDLLADAAVDAVWLPQPARGKLDFQHLATADQEGFYEPEHPEFGQLEPHPPLGYQPVDLREFDGALGTERELRSLVEAAHDRDIEVIVDTVLNHMANPDPAPADLWGDADDPTATTRLDWPQFETEEHFTHVPADDYRGEIENDQYDESLLALPNLDVRHPEVQAAHADYLTAIADMGVDGVRFDAAAHVWPWYFEEEIIPLCADLGLWRVGEVWEESHTDTLLEYVDTGMDVFDFPLYADVVDAFEQTDLSLVAEGNGVVHENPDAAVTFVQNHDAAGPGVGPDSPEGEPMRLATALILSYPGTPHLFNTTVGEDLEDDRVRDLIRVKNTLARGELLHRHVGREVYLYEREGNLLAGINVDDNPHTNTVEAGWEPGTVLVDHVGQGEPIEVDDTGEVAVSVPGGDYVMYAPEQSVTRD